MIYLKIPTFPPSANQAYANIRGTNKRVLTKEGQSYKIETTTHIVRTYAKELVQMKPDKGYHIAVRFHFDEITNKGWPKTAKSKYKKQDVGNRLKLLEDALKDACGIDDSQHISLFLIKKEAKDKPFTEVWIWGVDEPGPLSDAGDYLERLTV